MILFGVASCAADITSTPSPTATFTPPPTVTQIPTFSKPEPPQVVEEYSASDEFFPNPERGFSTEIEFDDEDYAEYYEGGITLGYATFRLDEYREEELPAEFLANLDDWFGRIRGSGLKVIVRFAYNDGPYPFPEPDASLEQILIHIQQLTPILQKNADVIAWLEAGFVGAWGEWHTSTNGLDDDPQAKSEILFALLNALSPDRSILLRYPVDLMTNFPQPLSLETAFNGSNQARVGFHNDCFVSSPDDEKTYARDGIRSIEEEMNYLSATTRFVPVGGETCAYEPPRSDCPTALSEMQVLHFDEIGDGWYPETLQAWEAQGCYAEMESRLGYRLSLVSSSINERVAPGGIINLSIELENSGFSSIKNPRPLYLILDGETYYELLLPIDPRLWAAGENSTFTVQARIPADAPEGEYQVALWLPDAYESLREYPQYAVRFANPLVWDEDSGYNVIRSLRVDSRAEGETDPNAAEFSILP